MGFVRILVLIVVLLAVVVGGLAIFRGEPNTAPPQADVEQVPTRTTPVAAPRRSEPREAMSPADASSPAEITAREAIEAQARLEKEQEESTMMVPDMSPTEMMPPDVAPPVK